MDLRDKKVLLVGLARTGISTVKKLNNMGAEIIVNDLKEEDKLKDIINDLKGYNVKYILGKHIEDVANIHLAIVSPGVPLDLPFIQKLKESKVEVIGEIELSYRLTKGVFIGITGTNGKTTTTTLVGEIFKGAQKDTYVVGNIGNPVIEVVDQSDKNTILVTELSSFQLESTKYFRPKVSAILNITPDHLNRHKTMENYINAKAKIFENQEKKDFIVLNYDCLKTRMLSSRCKGKVVFFSRTRILEEGIFLHGENIVVKFKNIDTILMDKKEIKIPGNHNLENALAAIAMGIALDIDLKIIKEVLSVFNGVEHRLEFVRKIKEVSFVNDSKGTNPDASIKAIEAYEDPIILIAGGMDKKSDFTEFVQSFHGKVKEMVLLGETSEIIEKTAQKGGFTNCHRVDNMKEAVQKAYSLSKPGYIVLLSPACASWDMYESYEVRGADFKNNVLSL